jgi:gamma-glutamylcyclotransferase (GGCT)/AIG2-like uncharacterized protein YtfP
MMELVFVYGTLKKGKHNHYVIKSGRYDGEGMLSDVLMYTNGSFPILFNGSNRVLGELYYCNPTVMSHLDLLEGNGSMYNREKKPVTIPDGTVKDAWVYLGVPEFWNFDGEKIETRYRRGIHIVPSQEGVQVFK